MISLLNFAYLPCIINSLVIFGKGGRATGKIAKVQWQMPKLCLNAALYFLSQTFKTFAENGVKLLKILAIILFTKQSSAGLPEYLLEKINVDYEECRQNVFKFSMRSLKKTETSNFLKYIQQNYNAAEHFSYFIEKHYQIDQNENFDFLSHLRDEMSNLVTKEGSEAKKEVDKEELIMLQETTMRNILIEKLNDGDLDSLYQYHAFLSEQYGVPLGVFDDP